MSVKSWQDHFHYSLFQGRLIILVTSDFTPLKNMTIYNAQAKQDFFPVKALKKIESLLTNLWLV